MGQIPDRIMAQSHTSLSCYTTYPRQYEAKYIAKDVKFEATEATEWGNNFCLLGACRNMQNPKLLLHSYLSL